MSKIKRVFDDDNLYWVKDQELNMMFVRSTLDQFNELSEILDWVSLNDAFDRLGFPRTMKGQKLGWMKKENVRFKVKTVGLYDIKIVFKGLAPLSQQR